MGKDHAFITYLCFYGIIAKYVSVKLSGDVSISEFFYSLILVSISDPKIQYRSGPNMYSPQNNNLE